MPPRLLVKGISDWGDEQKGDCWKAAAAYNATSLAYHVLSNAYVLQTLGALGTEVPSCLPEILEPSEWQALRLILTQIRDFNLIREAFQASLPDHASPDFIPQNWQDLQTLEKLILRLYPGEAPTPTVVRFVDDLVARLQSNDQNQTNQPIVQRLNPWLDQIIQKHRYKKPHKKPLSPSSANHQLIPCYLQVLIQPETSQTEQVRVNAALRLADQIHHLTLNDQQPDNQPGQLYKFDHMPNLLQPLREQAFSWLRDKTIPYNRALTLEIFLPICYLNRAVHRWTFEDQLGGKLILGCTDNLVLKIYERDAFDEFFHYLKAGWRALQNYIQGSSNLQVCRWAKVPSGNEVALKKELVDAQSVGLFLSSRLSKKQEQVFFKALVRSGLPLVLWPDGASLSETDQEVWQQWLSPDQLHNEQSFFEQVRKEREKINIEKSRKNQGIWPMLVWDNPDRRWHK